MPISDDEHALVATMETGGAQALAAAALDYLGAHDQSSDDLQVAAYLLSTAAKLADHAALCRRRSVESAPGPSNTAVSMVAGEILAETPVVDPVVKPCGDVYRRAYGDGVRALADALKVPRD